MNNTGTPISGLSTYRGGRLRVVTRGENLHWKSQGFSARAATGLSPQATPRLVHAHLERQERILDQLLEGKCSAGETGPCLQQLVLQVIEENGGSAIFTRIFYSLSLSRRIASRNEVEEALRTLQRKQRVSLMGGRYSLWERE